MDDDLTLLVLDLSAFPARTGSGGDVARAMDAVAATGAQIRQSSGRILLVESTEDEQSHLSREVPGSRLLSLDARIPTLSPPLDESERLFVDALHLRMSADYRRQKSGQKPGESPEEKLMFTASCVPEGESND